MTAEVSQRTLWLVRESAKARLYTRIPPERMPTALDQVWVPLSIIEHTTKQGDRHVVTLPNWFLDKKDL